MRRYFNTEGQCQPDIHYMVRLDERLSKIRKLYVDQGKYFIINRGRQYGKTTTLMELQEYLKDDYIVAFMDFQIMGEDSFQNARAFADSFAEHFVDAISDKISDNENAALQEFIQEKALNQLNMNRLFFYLSRMCEESPQPIVLMVDEVDSASNNQVFIDFLATLRGYYLNRNSKPIFHSVILAGVYDIKNLKLKIRTEEEHQYNSPWNIAAKFNLDMSFSVVQIAAMLQEYDSDSHTGMDTDVVAKCIYDYTFGYPYLVSAICKMLDEELPEKGDFADPSKAWTQEGIAEAVKMMLKENTTLFDNMVKQLDMYPDLRSMIKDVLYQGKQIPFSPLVKSMNLGMMFGYLKEQNGNITVANRIFEMGLLNMFIAEESAASEPFQYGQRYMNQFIRNDRLDMELVLNKFVEYFTEIYGSNDERFVEAYGRKFFLLYLKPIINGTGNYYMESQTRDARRTDLIVDYAGEQFIVEMKIWHGNEYNERGEEQLMEYLNCYRLQKGYMLSFNFNKRKMPGVKEVRIGNRVIVEAVV